MDSPSPEIQLSIVITIVSGRESARKCLAEIVGQVDFRNAEIIVPFDRDCETVGELAAEFQPVRFIFIENEIAAGITARNHRLYDLRRAAGLGAARGKIVAMTEDHAMPAEDWCEKILAAHQENDAAVIGGAIDNGVDEPLNRSWYYADFGRYGRPLERTDAEYVSDVNVSYKRAALLGIRHSWNDKYQETIVHRDFKLAGEKLYLDEKIVVYQHRPPLGFAAALGERIEWGRVFAETRSAELSFSRRLLYGCGTIFLPPLLLKRAVGNMLRQKISGWKITETLIFLAPLLFAWSVGELLGYLSAAPETAKISESANDSNYLKAKIRKYFVRQTL